MFQLEQTFQLSEGVSGWRRCFSLVEVYQLSRGVSARSSVSWLVEIICVYFIHEYACCIDWGVLNTGHLTQDT